MAEEAESRDLDARLEAHSTRVAKLEAMVEKRRLESLALRELAGKETTLREEMKRLDASVEKRTRSAALDEAGGEVLAGCAPARPGSTFRRIAAGGVAEVALAVAHRAGA